MPFHIKARKRSNKPLTIGLAGGPGSGKTWSAMLLAHGISGRERFGVIDTEGGRAMLYEEKFDFDHSEITAPFDSETYMEAIDHYDKQGRRVIVIDNASDEYSGVGGLLDQQEEELTRLAGNDLKKRDRCKPLSWKTPKKKHERFVEFLQTVQSAMILCFRAKSKIELVRNDKGKLEMQEKKGLIGYQGWFPMVEKNMPFEMTGYFMLLAEGPGVPHPIKLIEQHRAIFPTGESITVATGEQLGQWAKRKKGESESDIDVEGHVVPPLEIPAQTPTSRADESLIDVMTKIADTAHLDELERLGVEIKGLTGDQQNELRPHYKQKMAELRQAAT